MAMVHGDPFTLVNWPRIGIWYHDGQFITWVATDNVSGNKQTKRVSWLNSLFLVWLRWKQELTQQLKKSHRINSEPWGVKASDELAETARRSIHIMWRMRHQSPVVKSSCQEENGRVMLMTKHQGRNTNNAYYCFSALLAFLSFLFTYTFFFIFLFQLFER